MKLMDQNEINLNALIETEQFGVRCPECLKLYSVKLAEIREMEPKFKCVQCETRFAVKIEEALGLNVPAIGYPVSEPLENEPATQKTHALEIESFSCPKCATPYALGEKECKKCGVYFLKFEETVAREKRRPALESFSASPEVRDLWENVLNQYESQELHRNFVQACWADRCLDYAAHMYATILEVVPQDEMALKAQKEVTALTTLRFEIAADVHEAKPRKWLDNVSYLKGAGVQLRKIKFTNIIMVACGFIIMSGMLMPGMRNMIGFGTSVLFFILALRFYFRVI
jgi:hypothetical protein